MATTTPDQEKTNSISAADNDATCSSVTGNVTTATLPLNDGTFIPRVALGVYQSAPGKTTYNAVLAALKLGYRHIDTAHLYGNEKDVGRAVRDSGIPRAEIYITTKLWPDMDGEPKSGYDAAIKAGLASQKRLGTYIDLYLIHSPVWEKERVNAWCGLQELVKRKVVRSIGVSNYGVHHLKELLADKRTTIVPAVNQIELHPFLRHDDIERFCASNKILIEAYSPLAKAKKFKDVPRVKAGKTPAQIMLRWGLQRNYIILPKSVNTKRIEENSLLFDWSLSADAMKKLNSLDEYYTTGWDPTVWD
eukprot:g2639.t1